MTSFAYRSPDTGPEPVGAPLAAVGELLSRKALVEEYLADLAFSGNPRLDRLVRAMRHSLLAGGDRVRPVLCVEVARTFGLEPSAVLPSATAVELIHTISLVHGDLPAMGNADCRRRRRPACHESFGEATAILAGDGFFGESLALVANHQRGTPQQLVEVVRELARSTGVEGMIGGQALGVDRPQDVEALLLARRKTVSLIEASARIGAILADAGPEEREVISEYAQQLGLCLLAAARAPDPEDRGTDATVGGPAGEGEAPSAEAGGLPTEGASRRLPDEEAFERALEALRKIRRETDGLAGLVRYGPLLGPGLLARAGNRSIGAV